VGKLIQPFPFRLGFADLFDCRGNLTSRDQQALVILREGIRFVLSLITPRMRSLN
jgi:hypothetical protein